MSLFEVSTEGFKEGEHDEWTGKFGLNKGCQDHAL